MGYRTVLTDIIPERSSAKVTFTLKDENGSVVPGSSLTTFTLTLYPTTDSTTTINSRNDQNVLNVNGVTVDSQGVVIWLVDPADNAIIDTDLTVENHIALFEWTWGSGKAGRHEILMTIQNLTLVT